MWFPSDALRDLALFELAYDDYARSIAAVGRVPASREVILAEARASIHPVLTVLARKRARLVP